MTWRQFNQALAYLQMNPPEQAANHRTASLMAQIANFAGKSLKEGKTVKPSDYLSKPKQSSVQQKEFLKRITNG